LTGKSFEMAMMEDAQKISTLLVLSTISWLGGLKESSYSEATPIATTLWSDWRRSRRIQRQKGALFRQGKNLTASPCTNTLVPADAGHRPAPLNSFFRRQEQSGLTGQWQAP